MIEAFLRSRVRGVPGQGRLQHLLRGHHPCAGALLHRLYFPQRAPAGASVRCVQLPPGGRGAVLSGSVEPFIAGALCSKRAVWYSAFCP